MNEHLTSLHFRDSETAGQKQLIFINSRLDVDTGEKYWIYEAV